MDAETERKPYNIAELKKIFINSKMTIPPKKVMRDFVGEMNRGVNNVMKELLKPENLIPKSKTSPKPKKRKVKSKSKRAKLRTFSHNIPRPNKAQGVLISKAGVKSVTS